MTNRFMRALANRWAASTLVLAVAAGFGVKEMINSDRHLRAGMIRDVRLLGQSLDVAQIAALAGSPDDLATPCYRRLREQFQTVCRSRANYRCVYLISRRRVPPGAPAPADLGQFPLMYLVDSEPEDSPNYGAPGQPLAPVNKDDMRHYDDTAPIVQGPLSDGIGTWVIAGAPLTDPRRGEVLAWLCIDVDARVWRFLVAGAAVPSALAALSLLAVLWLPARRAHRLLTEVRRQVLLVLLAGLIITTYAAHWARGTVVRNRQWVFAELAEIQTHRVLERLLDLDRVTLAGLAAHFHAGATEDPIRFRAYVDALGDIRGVLAWERLSGLESAGDMCLTRQADALDRDRLCLAADASRAATAALTTGLTSASDLLTCPARGGKADRFICVFRAPVTPRQEGAAIGAVLSVERFLAADVVGQSCALHWHAADGGVGVGPQSSAGVSGLAATTFRLFRPLLVFGKTFHIEAVPTEQFLAAYPDQATPLVTLIGLLLTLGATVTLWHFLARRKALERLVAQRTQDVRASEAEVKRLLDKRTREWHQATATALAAGEEEAGRIGRELHDTLCQDLIGMARHAETFRYIDCTSQDACGQLKEKMAWLAMTSASAAKRARELSYQIAETDCATGTLSEILTGNLAQLGSLYGFEAEIDIEAHLPALSSEAVKHLVRIVREAAVNAVRHARADKVWLTVLRTGQDLFVAIGSNGSSSLAPDAWRDGLGLRQMRMRAALLDAHLSFDHTERRITVELIIPNPDKP